MNVYTLHGSDPSPPSTSPTGTQLLHLLVCLPPTHTYTAMWLLAEQQWKKELMKLEQPPTARDVFGDILFCPRKQPSHTTLANLDLFGSHPEATAGGGGKGRLAGPVETASWERARPEQAECGRPHWGRTSSTEGPGELSLEADPWYHFLQPLRDPLQLHCALSGVIHPPKAPNSVAGRGQAGRQRQMRLLPPAVGHLQSQCRAALECPRACHSSL